MKNVAKRDAINNPVDSGLLNIAATNERTYNDNKTTTPIMASTFFIIVLPFCAMFRWDVIYRSKFIDYIIICNIKFISDNVRILYMFLYL